MVDNENQLVYFSLALIIGDNLGLHSILGFTESFMANYPCRFCKCSKIECNYQTVQNDNELRNEDNYSSDIVMNNFMLTYWYQRNLYLEPNTFFSCNPKLFCRYYA